LDKALRLRPCPTLKFRRLRSAVQFVRCAAARRCAQDRFGCHNGFEYQLPLATHCCAVRGRVLGSAFWVGGPLDEAPTQARRYLAVPPIKTATSRSRSAAVNLSLQCAPGDLAITVTAPRRSSRAPTRGPPAGWCPHQTGKRAHRWSADATIGFGGAAWQVTAVDDAPGHSVWHLAPAAAPCNSPESQCRAFAFCHQQIVGRAPHRRGPRRAARAGAYPPSPGGLIAAAPPRSPAAGPAKTDPRPPCTAPPGHGGRPRGGSGAAPSGGGTDLPSPWPHHRAPAGRA